MSVEIYVLDHRGINVGPVVQYVHVYPGWSNMCIAVPYNKTDHVKINYFKPTFYRNICCVVHNWNVA